MMIETRYELAIERLNQINVCPEVEGLYKDYFEKVSSFLLLLDRTYNEIKSGEYWKQTIDELAIKNRELYEDILGKNYARSYANPVYAVKFFGIDMGRLLSLVYSQARSAICPVFEGNIEEFVIDLELFIQVYCIFALNVNEGVSYKEVYDACYWYFSDYSDEFLDRRVREQVDPDLSFARDIVIESDLNDLRYLYKYGEYIGDNEIRIAQYLNSISQDKIDLMAKTYVDGYVRGFELGGKDLSKKKTVDVRFNVGFERVIRSAIRLFSSHNLTAIIYRGAMDVINRASERIGYQSTSANKQYDYDHMKDVALFVDKDFNVRRLGVYSASYEERKELSRGYAGPAVIEVFGEEPFLPAENEECIVYEDKKQKLFLDFTNQKSELVSRYIIPEERSFTIIAFPLPSIGKDFEEIFDEVIKLNTLEYDTYKEIQQKIIDVLDRSTYVRVKGFDGNKTDLRVSLIDLPDPGKQTKFENCLADVNIPLGEVFTSPKLAGTEGVLHVKGVYLNEIYFKDICLTFKDGFITDYTCSNFEEQDKCKAFVKKNVLFDHDTLPIGEFAIGTNTLAYAMARKYEIERFLPILIAEKTGPHFAVGDTCYSRSEDVVVYNPDGKEIYARDNEHTLKYRKSESKKAYYNCHTDITIPYDELESLVAVGADGDEVAILRDGRFVLEGLELLNESLG